MSDEGFRWFCYRVRMVYEVLDEAIDEFIDDDFITDWKGLEQSTYLVWAQDDEQARRELIESTEGVEPSVNVYGQKIADRVLKLEARGTASFDPPRYGCTSIETYWDFWNARTATDPGAFLDEGRPQSVAPGAMWRTIAAGERTRRYLELRAAPLEECQPPMAADTNSIEQPQREEAAVAAELESLRWWGVQAHFFHETLDQPIEEFLDASFVRDWMGIEIAYLLVSARNFDEVYRLVELREDGQVVLNTYGQRVRRVLLTTNAIGFSEGRLMELTAASEGRVVGLCRDFWDTTEDQDPREFLARIQPPPIERPHMIGPICFFEHSARYEELRGPLNR